MYRKSNRKIIAVAAGLTLSFLLSLHNPPKSRAAEEVCPADAKVANFDFTFKDINGKNVALSAYKGKVVLLDFWATWCPPCRKEIPGFVELYDRYKAQGFVVLGVSMDDSTSDVKKFMRTLKMNYPILLGNEREDVEKAYGPLPGMPTSFVIARDGKICHQHTGFVAKEEFERQIKALL